MILIIVVVLALAFLAWILYDCGFDSGYNKAWNVVYPPLKEETVPSERPRPTGLRTICPDGGTCHHQCGVSQICFRVDCCEPLSGVYPKDEWPLGVR